MRQVHSLDLLIVLFSPFLKASVPPIAKPSNYNLKSLTSILTFLTLTYLDDNGPAIAGGIIGAISLVIIVILIVIIVTVVVR